MCAGYSECSLGMVVKSVLRSVLWQFSLDFSWALKVLGRHLIKASVLPWKDWQHHRCTWSWGFFPAEVVKGDKEGHVKIKGFFLFCCSNRVEQGGNMSSGRLPSSAAFKEEKKKKGSLGTFWSQKLQKVVWGHSDPRSFSSPSVLN